MWWSPGVISSLILPGSSALLNVLWWTSLRVISQIKSEMQVSPIQIDTTRVVFSPDFVPLDELESAPIVLLVGVGCAGATVVDV